MPFASGIPRSRWIVDHAVINLDSFDGLRPVKPKTDESGSRGRKNDGPN